MSLMIDPQMLSKVRLQRGLSQQNLADASGVGIATIKRIEAAQSPLRCHKTTADRLAAALAISVDELSEDTFERVIDIGGDIELVIKRDSTGEDVMRAAADLARLVDRRNFLLRRHKPK